MLSVTKAGVTLGSPSVWHSNKGSQSGESCGIVCAQLDTGHCRSLKRVRLRALRIHPGHVQGQTLAINNTAYIVKRSIYDTLLQISGSVYSKPHLWNSILELSQGSDNIYGSHSNRSKNLSSEISISDAGQKMTACCTELWHTQLASLAQAVNLGSFTTRRPSSAWKDSSASNSEW